MYVLKHLVDYREHVQWFRHAIQLGLTCKHCQHHALLPREELDKRKAECGEAMTQLKQDMVAFKEQTRLEACSMQAEVPLNGPFGRGPQGS